MAIAKTLPLILYAIVMIIAVGMQLWAFLSPQSVPGAAVVLSRVVIGAGILIALFAVIRRKGS